MKYLLTTVVLLCLLQGTADAQSWMHPPKTDYDETSEQTSLFWAQIVASEDSGYINLVDHARALWKAGSSDQRTLALKELATAAKGKPDKPEAYYWLGSYLSQSQKWPECVDALERSYAIDPNFKPKGQSSSLDFSLARCHLYSGEYESAIAKLRRIMSTSTGSINIEHLLGEALMALGHLDQAIDSLRHAAGRSSNKAANFTLAVALDRAEQLRESKAILKRLVARDFQLRVLHAADKRFAPKEDEHYTLGLANAAAGKSAHALYRFRLYQKLAPDNPWKGRVKAHLKSYQEISIIKSLDLQGPGSIFVRNEVGAAIQLTMPALRLCLRDQPLMLAEVQLGFLAKRQQVQVNARATIVLSHEVSLEDQSKAINCLESAARNIRIPAKKVVSGSHAAATFHIVK